MARKAAAIAPKQVTSPSFVKVWDLCVRAFHWSVVIAFAVACYTGGNWDGPHLVSGYLVFALVLQIIWGFIGFDPAASKGLGMAIIGAFIQRIGAKLQVDRGDNHRGTRFTVLFS